MLTALWRRTSPLINYLNSDSMSLTDSWSHTLIIINSNWLKRINLRLAKSNHFSLFHSGDICSWDWLLFFYIQSKKLLQSCCILQSCVIQNHCEQFIQNFVIFALCKSSSLYAPLSVIRKLDSLLNIWLYLHSNDN